MSDVNILVARAQRFLGPTPLVQAAGLLGVKVNHVKDSQMALTTGSPAGGLVDPPGIGTVAAVGGRRPTREARVRSQGTTVRMLVAVTSSAVHLIEIGPVGVTPTREALSFDRATLAVGVRRFGLSRRMTLDDGRNRVELTTSLSRLSSDIAGTRTVFDALT